MYGRYWVTREPEMHSPEVRGDKVQVEYILVALFQRLRSWIMGKGKKPKC